MLQTLGFHGQRRLPDLEMRRDNLGLDEARLDEDTGMFGIEDIGQQMCPGPLTKLAERGVA